MDFFMTDELLNILMISVIFSTVLMALIQKFKSLSFITKSYQVWFLNLIFSFLWGIPFAVNLYNVSLMSAIWVGLFSFIGAPTIYELMKNQKMINYKPKSSNDNSDYIKIKKENEIKRT